MALVLMITPRFRQAEGTLVIGCVTVIGSIWIDKGLGMVVAGFVPNPLGEVTEYWPTLPEAAISLGIYGIGALTATVLFRVALKVRGELGT